MLHPLPAFSILRRLFATTLIAAGALLGGCGKSAPANDAAAASGDDTAKLAELTAQYNQMLLNHALVLAELRMKDQRLREYEERMGRIRPGLVRLEASSTPVGDKHEARIVFGASAPTDLDNCQIKLVFTKPLISGETGCFIIGPKNENVPKPEARIESDSVLVVNLSKLPANQYLVIVASSKEKADIATAEVFPAPQLIQ